MTFIFLLLIPAGMRYMENEVKEMQKEAKRGTDS